MWIRIKPLYSNTLRLAYVVSIYDKLAITVYLRIRILLYIPCPLKRGTSPSVRVNEQSSQN